MSKKIIISASSDLATDQRVQKVAKSCFDYGFDVLLLGRKLKNSPPVAFPYEFKRFRLLFSHSFLFYAELNIRLFFYLLFKKCDILLSNDTDTLLPNYLVSKIHSRKLVFDAHELFPEVPELVSRNFVRNFWTRIEDLLFPKLAFSYTVSASIAEYYKAKYGIDMAVIKNVPYRQTEPTKKSKNEIKRILYQGALNKGRCLEFVIPAMKYVENAELIIVGDGDLRTELEKLTMDLSLSEKVTFFGKMLPNDFRAITQSADVGLCLLENMGLSYYYSLPNRIFDYLHAGVPVLASDFPEIRNFVGTFKTGVLTDKTDPDSIAELLKKMISSPMDTSHFERVASEYCWENEEKKLMEIINK